MPFPSHVPSGQKLPARPGQAWIEQNLASLRRDYPQMWVAASENGLEAFAAEVSVLIARLPGELRDHPAAPYTVRFIERG